jgi:hypothetical protein
MEPLWSFQIDGGCMVASHSTFEQNRLDAEARTRSARDTT